MQLSFSGIMSIVIGLLISLAAIHNNQYLWLLGSFPLIIIGIWIVLRPEEGYP